MVAKKKTTKKAAAPKKTAAKKTVAKKTVAKKTKRSVAKKAAPKAAVRTPAKVNGGWWGNSFSPSGVLIAMAAVIGIVAMFTGWLHMTFSGVAVGWNGWDLLTASGENKEVVLANSWQVVIPLLCWVCSIIALIAIILPAFKVRTNKVATDVIVVVLGIIAFILVICFLFGQCGGYHFNGKFIDYLAPGFYMALVSSIVMILAGLADAIKNAKA